MILYVLTSIPLPWAIFLAWLSGLTLKPMIRESVALAKSTSDNTIPPTAEWTTWIFTSSVANLLIPSLIASTEPLVSAFKIIFTVFNSPSCKSFIMSLTRDSTENDELSYSFNFVLFSSAFALASFWFLTETNWSPAVGDSSQPIISIGEPGSTDFTVLLLWSNIDFTLQNAWPA